MNKIEELVESIRRKSTHYADQDFYDIDIEDLLLKFAREMCDKQRQICADNVELEEDEEDEGCEVWIDKLSILNSPYPEELL